jgi:hypothetical protein
MYLRIDFSNDCKPLPHQSQFEGTWCHTYQFRRTLPKGTAREHTICRKQDGLLKWIKCYLLQQKGSCFIHRVVVPMTHDNLGSDLIRIRFIIKDNCQMTVRVIRSVVLLSTHCGHLYHQMCH